MCHLIGLWCCESICYMLFVFNAVNSLLMFFIHILLHCQVMYICSAGEVAQRSMCLEHGAYHKTYSAAYTIGRDFSLFRKL
jgi:hypothetical protein